MDIIVTFSEGFNDAKLFKKMMNRFTENIRNVCLCVTTYAMLHPKATYYPEAHAFTWANWCFTNGRKNIRMAIHHARVSKRDQIKANRERDEEMCKNASCIVAFTNGRSMKVQRMLDLAKKHRLQIRVVEYKE
jgi:hypothetical protein